MVNVLLAAAAYNLTKWMRVESKKIFLFVLSRLSKIFDLVLIPKIKITSRKTF